MPGDSLRAALLSQILGIEGKAYGSDCEIVSHVRWHPDGQDGPESCVSYCQRCRIIANLERELPEHFEAKGDDHDG